MFSDIPISRRGAIQSLGASVALPFAGQGPGAAPRRLEGKVALVTGSGRNLGRIALLELARRGASVIVNARSNQAEADSVVREAEALGAEAIALLADVSDEAEVERMVDAGLQRFGHIDVLINNAGLVRVASPITEMSTEEWRQTAAVNMDGPFFCTRAVVPSMIENGGGRIVTVSGLNSFHGRPNWSHVCASKMAAFGMTRALAVELAPYNVLVNHVVPGAWDFSEEVESGEATPDSSDRIPMGRVGSPQELANVYAFLASDDASFITGQTFHVNGGEFRY